MGKRFAELDHQETARGSVSLRRRRDPVLGEDVYEVLLGDEYLMSSAFTVAEEALARLALAEVPSGRIDVVVGGLGLGCTALAALADPRVQRMHVVDAFEPVIDWHRRRLLPASSGLLDDSRCSLVRADFFLGLQDATAWGLAPDSRVDAVLVDIDHSPRHLLHPGHAAFYTRPGLAALADRLEAGGVVGLWSDDRPDAAFLDDLAAVFPRVQAHVVGFDNPLTGGRSSNTVYVASRSG
jgi:spermidine synthase